MNCKTAKTSTLDIQGTSVAVVSSPQGDYISLTEMLRAKDGDFFISRLAAQPQNGGVLGYLGAHLQLRF